MKTTQQRWEQAKIALLQSYNHPLLIPRLEKIVISMGLATLGKEESIVEHLLQELSLIAGQKAILTRAKRSIAGFKLRAGQVVGLKVTLRRKKMYDFFTRFCNIACPRIRDFRGFPRGGDGNGNYTCGLEDQQIFPEISLDKIKKVQGMHITFVTSAKNNSECQKLLEHLGFPFQR